MLFGRGDSFVISIYQGDDVVYIYIDRVGMTIVPSSNDDGGDNDYHINDNSRAIMKESCRRACHANETLNSSLSPAPHSNVACISNIYPTSTYVSSCCLI